MEKQLTTYISMLYLQCANVLCTVNKFSNNLKESLKGNLFIRNFENKIVIRVYYLIMQWQRRKAPGGGCVK